MIAAGRLARIATGVALAALSVQPLLAGGWVRWLAAAEIAAAIAFCLSHAWRWAGFALLAILGFALTHHALRGEFAASLFFASIAVMMALVHERS